MDIDLLSTQTYRLFREKLEEQDVPDVPHLEWANHGIEVRDIEGRGRGWVAKENIPAGTLLLTCKPFAIIMDSEVDDLDEADEKMDEEHVGEYEGNFNVDTALLILRVVSRLQDNKQLWNQLDLLFPREADLPRMEPWRCTDSAMNDKVNEELKKIDFLSQTQRERLKLIVRMNELSVETNGEQLCHMELFSKASGMALYIKASFFNHDDTPNVARYNMGDVCFFRTNQDVPAGKELCVSYIESDLLCESAAVRMQSLGTRDFELQDVKRGVGDEGPVVGPDALSELGATPAAERLATIEELLQDPDMVERFRPKDLKDLSYLKAFAYTQLEQFDQALVGWEACIQSTLQNCPPNDEGIVGFAIQAALCALACDETEKAREHTRLALQTHAIAFGPEFRLFELRYNDELRNCALADYGEDFIDLAQSISEEH